MHGSTLARQIKKLDKFGSPINVNYKGQETYNTVLGGLCTLTVYVLSCVLILQASQEIIEMNDPIITDFSRPLPVSERENLVPINFDDYGLIFGLSSLYFSKERPFGAPVPPSVGSWVIQSNFEKSHARNLSAKSGKEAKVLKDYKEGQKNDETDLGEASEAE